MIKNYQHKLHTLILNFLIKKAWFFCMELSKIVQLTKRYKGLPFEAKLLFFLSLFFSSYLSVLRTTFRTKNLHPSFRTTQQFLSRTDFQSSRNLRSVIRQPWPFLKAHKNHEQYFFLNQLTYLTTPFHNFLKLTGR